MNVQRYTDTSYIPCPFSSLHPVILFAMNQLEEIIVKNSKKPFPILTDDAYLIDTHCHLDMEAYSTDFSTTLDTAYQHNIKTIITIGIDESSSKRAVELAEAHTMLFATVGVHPHDVEHITETTLNTLATLAEEHKDQVVGYGEIGLDYAKQYAPQDIQRHSFARQLALSKELQLPVIIHDREAHDDTIRLLKAEAPFKYGGVMHCFSGDLEFAHQVLDFGFHISIPGIVTFKNAKEMKEVATHIPLESMLLETDGPFLAPMPYRGKRNEPAYLLYTAQEIATLREIDINQLAKSTSANARTLFNLPPLQ